MDQIDIVQVFSRWLHITAACAAVGGAIFMKLALHPASESLPVEDRKKLREGVRARWSTVVKAAIAVLLATGVYNFIMINKDFNLDRDAYASVKKIYHAVFGVKFLLALAVFGLASVLVGKSATAQKVRENAGKWLTILVSILLVLLFLSSFLKNLPHNQKRPAIPAAAAEAGS